MTRFKTTLDLAGPEYLTHMHRLGKALECVSPEITIVEETADQAMGDGGDHDGVWRGNRLQARHQICGFANGGVLLSYALPNKIADDDHPRADGDAGLQCLTTGCLQVSDGPEDGEAGEDCPLRIILVRG